MPDPAAPDPTALDLSLPPPPATPSPAGPLDDEGHWVWALLGRIVDAMLDVLDDIDD